ncbi:centromere protein H-like isoform X2 [Mercenaria mercenaria]|nr:centromere protein H-like isoform X2 [Mercenaria mercenaria]
MATPENDLVPSISPANAERGSVSRLSQATPELMNISPLSDGTPVSRSKEKSLEELLKKREWLYSQRNQLKSQIDAIQSESAKIIDKMPPDQLKKLYEKLREDLLQKTVVRDGRELILKGECLNKATMSILQCELNGQCDSQTLDKKRELENLLEEYTTLASQVAKEHKENSKLRENVERLKMENYALLKKSRELYSEIGEKRKAKEEELKALTTDSKGKSIHELMQSKLQLNFVQNNTLQGLILGSGLNWAQDEKLNKLMIDAGKNLHM